jgi:hypothetical protein
MIEAASHTLSTYPYPRSVGTHRINDFVELCPTKILANKKISKLAVASDSLQYAMGKTKNLSFQHTKYKQHIFMPSSKN